MYVSFLTCGSGHRWESPSSERVLTCPDCGEPGKVVGGTIREPRGRYLGSPFESVGFRMTTLAEDRDPDNQRALAQQREENEWACALDRDVDRNGAKNHTTAPTEPRAFEVQRKKERLKAGEPVPARFAHLKK